MICKLSALIMAIIFILDTLRSLKPRIVIVEEAAEVLEAHLLASLTD